MKDTTLLLLKKLYGDIDLPIEEVDEKYAKNGKNLYADCFEVEEETATRYYRFLSDEILKEELFEMELQMRINSYRRIKTIKNCVVFFTVLAVIGIIVGLIAGISFGNSLVKFIK